MHIACPVWTDKWFDFVKQWDDFSNPLNALLANTNILHECLPDCLCRRRTLSNGRGNTAHNTVTQLLHFGNMRCDNTNSRNAMTFLKEHFSTQVFAPLSQQLLLPVCKHVKQTLIFSQNGSIKPEPENWCDSYVLVNVAGDIHYKIFF